MYRSIFVSNLALHTGGAEHHWRGWGICSFPFARQKAAFGGTVAKAMVNLKQYDGGKRLA